MPPALDFAPTDAAFNERLDAVRVNDYAATRNALGGAVTQLSPWITHGFASLPEIVERIRQREPLGPDDKLYAEFGWREFYQQVFAHLGEDIFADIRAPLPGVRYALALPDDIRHGATGLAVIDRAVRCLYETGYLHNHARMWLASYIIHARKIHWRVGADWMVGHLLDGDLASNHLSWQWVAATFSTKPYVFNAENVGRFAPPEWHITGSALDTDYPSLDALARSNEALPAGDATPTAEPPLLAAPPDAPIFESLRADEIDLIHPWSLAPRTSASARVGVIHLPFHRRFPWSTRRWNFVLSRMQEICDAIFIGNLATLGPQLDAKRITATDTLNPDYRAALATICTEAPRAIPRLFPWPPGLCRSFSQFWRAVHPGSKMLPP